MERTKGKWEAEAETITSGYDIYAPKSGTAREYICTTSGHAKANAEFICKAVNLHDELVEALEAGFKYLNKPHESEHGNTEIINLFHAVLAKAVQDAI